MEELQSTEEGKSGNLPEDFHLGREWARNTQCCSKPVGCTNMSKQCMMKLHPWKRRNNIMTYTIDGLIGAINRMVEKGEVATPYPAKVALRLAEELMNPSSDQTPDQEQNEHEPSRSGQDERKSHM